MKKSIAASKELKEISNLISSNDSQTQRVGISIAVGLGLRDIDIALLFLNCKIGWDFTEDHYPTASFLFVSKVFLSNKFEMTYSFYPPTKTVKQVLRFETYLNNRKLGFSPQQPKGIKKRSSPMGRLMHYLLKLIKRERLKLINK